MAFDLIDIARLAFERDIYLVSTVIWNEWKGFA